ncbi:MAG: AAA family ATPase [Pirellulaceae bacterium]|nr:AAA family ATPase [Pirellulaceae bacterium]
MNTGENHPLGDLPDPSAREKQRPTPQNQGQRPVEQAQVVQPSQVNEVTPPQAELASPQAAATVVPQNKQPQVKQHQGQETPTKRLFDRLTSEISKIFVGQDELVLGSLVALFSNGHILIESVPGLGKTLLVRTLGQLLGCDFGRIQFTADLMPSDITGAPIFNMKTQEFHFRPGPIFTQLLLADEINRAPAKTHAALLEIMQEYRVTVDGTSHELKRPFLVIATQNPVESEGTYNLPEAQLDRFMFKLIANYPSAQDEAKILHLHSLQHDLDDKLASLKQITTAEEVLKIIEGNNNIRIDKKLLLYINEIVRLTRRWPMFYMGASPRAGLGLMQAARTLAAFYGRDYAIPDDVIQVVLPALRHRVILTAEAEVEGQSVDEQLKALLRNVEVPRF